MTRRLAGSLGLTTLAVTGLVLLVLAVWGVARLDGNLRLAAQPQRVDDRHLELLERRCPRPHPDPSSDRT